MGGQTADNGQNTADGTRSLTVRQAAATVGLSERTIRRAIRHGELMAAKAGGVYQIEPATLAQYRETHGARARRPPRLPRLGARRRLPALGQIPAQVTPFIGRDREVTALQDLLIRPEGPRLVVLTGPGGVGKTRLALHVASAVDDAYADGVAFIPLAAIHDPLLVAATIASALGVREARDRPLADQIAASLADRRLLLVLDNFEQVVEAGPLVGQLLVSCPRLTALVTSRTRLRLSGETMFPVVALAVPLPEDELSAQQIAQVDGVRLFVARAQAVDPDFALTEENAAAVAKVCHQLEGLPLALELAAAHISVLSPAALLARLDRRLHVLTDGPRDMPARLRTMRDAIAWSYDLLDPAEQMLFRRLAVFSGGFTVTAAAQVSGGEELDILGGMSSLVDKSLLLRPTNVGSNPRFEMLETIREYGLEQLATHGELETAQKRHAAYFLALAEEADGKLRGREQRAQLARLDLEHDNLRTALAWSLTTPTGADDAVRLAGALHWFWYLRGHFSEGRQWLAAALANPLATIDTLVWAKALAGAGVLAFSQGDFRAARDLLGQSVAIGRAWNDSMTVAYGLQALVAGDLPHADHTVLRQQCAESVALYRKTENLWGLALALRNLGLVNIVTHQFDQAAEPFAECLALARELGDSWCLARALHYSGELARIQGDHKHAQMLYEESLTHYHAMNFRHTAAIVMHNLGYVAQLQGNPRLALSHFAEALTQQVEHGDRLNIAHCLGGVAGVVASLGQPAEAARLFGAADALLATMDAEIWPVDKLDFDRNRNDVHVHLGADVFAAAYSAGQALPMDAAVAEAFALITALGPSSRAGQSAAALTPAMSAAFGLTPREGEILRLLSRRATDREIADLLSISPRTVMHHVSNVLAKLGVENRRQAAHWATRLGLD